jgi:uncharacterized protein
VLTHYFLESSAFAKLFVRKKGSEPLVQLLEQVQDSRKLVSSLASLEVRSAIRRRQRASEIPPSDVSGILIALEEEILLIVEKPISSAVIDAARRIVDIHSLRTLDALHLATCIVARDTLQVSDICFVSADDALLQAAEAEQFPILNPLKM